MTKSLKIKKSKALTFSVIIPNYNGASFLTDCLNSLIKAISNCPDSNFELIFVDNGSKDNSCQIFTDFFQKNNLSNLRSTIYHLQSNLGFATAVNIGIKKAKYKWVVLLNNDLTIKPNWFQLISVAIKENNNSKIATFFGTVLTKDGTKFESQGLDFFYSGKCQNVSNGQPFLSKDLALQSSKALVWGASAALVVYNKKIITKIGLFDQDFFAYEEDVDLALRLHNLGFKTLYVPQALSYHLGGGTSNKMKNIRSRSSFRNWFFIILKNYSKEEFNLNFKDIFIERFHNFSYFFRETIKIYKLKSFIIFPFELIKILIEILFKLPKMFKKRQAIKKLKINQGTNL